MLRCKGLTPQPATPVPAAVEVVSEVVKGNDSVVPSPESPVVETPKSWQLVGWPANDLDEVDSQPAAAKSTCRLGR